MAVLTSTGRAETVVRGSQEASLVAAHWNAVQRYLRTGDLEPLGRFAGTSVGGIPLATTPTDLKRFFLPG